MWCPPAFEWGANLGGPLREKRQTRGVPQPLWPTRLRIPISEEVGPAKVYATPRCRDLGYRCPQKRRASHRTVVRHPNSKTSSFYHVLVSQPPRYRPTNDRSSPTGQPEGYPRCATCLGAVGRPMCDFLPLSNSGKQSRASQSTQGQQRFGHPTIFSQPRGGTSRL
jgi:hypothetical protein